MDYKKYNDYELIYLVRENDGTSRDILYEKYLPVLKSIAMEFYQRYKFYGYEYEDFLQEAYISFEKAILQYHDNRGTIFYTFVDLCIRRGMITFCRNISNSNKNKPYYFFIDLDDKAIPDYRNDINDYNLEYDFRKVFNILKLKLPLELSSILELRINGFNYSEISKLLTVPCSTVDYRMKKIKEEFTKYYCK